MGPTALHTRKTYWCAAGASVADPTNSAQITHGYTGQGYARSHGIATPNNAPKMPPNYQTKTSELAVLTDTPANAFSAGPAGNSRCPKSSPLD